MVIHQQLLRIKTLDNKSIFLRYTKGTKNINDVDDAIQNKIGYKCLNVDKISYVLDSNNIPYNKIANENVSKTPEDLLDTFNILRMTIGRIIKIKPPTIVQSIPLELIIKTLARTEFVISANTTTTIEELKCLIEDKHGIEPGIQKLIFKGKRLNDDKTLEDYEITTNSEIFITLNLRGGMYTEVSGRNGAYCCLPEITIFDMDFNEFITTSL